MKPIVRNLIIGIGVLIVILLIARWARRKKMAVDPGAASSGGGATLTATGNTVPATPAGSMLPLAWAQ